MKISNSLAQQNYDVVKARLSPQTAKPDQSQTDSAAFKAIHELASTVAKSEQAAGDLIAGGADPHSVIEAVATAELAVETATTIRDKAVEAFQELLRMPI
ncbi:MAG: flagellar hook-basal body complex protein FliE [Pseudomonadota bacterium]